MIYSLSKNTLYTLSLVIYILTFCSLVAASESGKHKTDLLIDNVNFHGHLNYLDYSSGKHVTLPMRASLLQSADKQHIIVDKTFTDPGYEVHSLSVLKINFIEETVTETTFSSDKTTEYQFMLTEFIFDTPSDWSITRKRTGKDDNRDALITIVETMKGKDFTSQTHVDYLDTAANENLRRNWATLSINEIE